MGLEKLIYINVLRENYRLSQIIKKGNILDEKNSHD